MAENKPRSKSEEVEDFGKGLEQAVVALGQELNTDETTRGLHKSTPLGGVIRDGFGSFTQRWEYIKGCVPLQELDKEGVGEVQCKIASPDGKARIVSMGRTPADWDPDNGGKAIPDAGERGDYLMAIAYLDDVEQGRADDATTYRYLDAEDLQGVQLQNSERLIFGQNMTRARQVKIEGLIERTAALVA